MQRELSSFPLPSNQKIKLHNAGFITVEDLIDLKPSELSKELSLTHEEALELLQVVRGKSATCSTEKQTIQDVMPSTSSQVANVFPTAAVIASRTQTAYDMLLDEQSQQSIITFSEALDGLLGGGIPLTKITEVCGAPGVGKTQLCMQLAVDVQIPEVFGGQAGTALYIDTEGSLIVDRLKDIASATIQHCSHIANLENNKDQQNAFKAFSVESILSNIQYFRCYDYVELIALVHLLPDIIEEHPKVRLIVVDSIAFHFRHDFQDFALRTRLLNGMAQSFIKLATLNKLAVVLTNQMTTRVTGGADGGSQLIPALGESWGHAATIRIILHWNQNERRALLYKSPSKQEATVSFQITMAGVRDITDVDRSHEEFHTEEGPPMKRQRTDH